MESEFLTKSIRLTREDNIGLADIIKNDPRVTRGPSEALRICFEDAAAHIPQWKKIIDEAKTLDYSDNIILEGNETKSFLVSREVFNKVLESINEQLGTIKPRISYITRLCIYNTRLKIHSAVSDSVIVTVSEINNVNRTKSRMSLEKFSVLSTDEKLIEIYKLLIERRI